MIQKSCVHQLRLIVYPVVCRVLYIPRWFSRWVSEPSNSSILSLPIIEERGDGWMDGALGKSKGRGTRSIDRG